MLQSRATAGLAPTGVLAAVLSCLLAACADNAGDSSPAAESLVREAATNIDPQAALQMAVEGLGGRDALERLAGFSMQATRDRYELGMGLEPGSGLVRATLSDVQVLHDIAGERLRLDYAHTNLYRMPRNVTELVLGGSGYILGRDFYYDKSAAAEAGQQAMAPDRWAITLKTERLLNPHLMVQEALADPSLLLPPGEANDPSGLQLDDDQVFPITLYFDESQQQRTVLVQDDWVRRLQDSYFLELSTGGNYFVDANWYLRWRAAAKMDDVRHYPLVIQDSVYPITLHVHGETGRISKLATMEHDLYYGDVPLDATYNDWREIDGQHFPMHVMLSIAGAPSLEVRRSAIAVNPDFDPAAFTQPEGVAASHDAALADRGRRLSQWIQGISHAGSPKPTVKPKINPTELSPGVHSLSVTPDDALRTLVVEQSAGVVVIEPGYQDLRGEAIIEWTAQNIPGKPLSHVVLTHFHLDHVGGVRPYVAAGAVLVAHELAESHYRRLFGRLKSKILPDAYDRNPVAAKIAKVPGDGAYRIEDPLRPVAVYPVRNRHTTDMVMVWVEKEQILFNGDLYSPGEDIPDKTPMGGVDLDRGIREQGLQVKLLTPSHGFPSVTYQEFKAHLAVDGY